MGPHRYIEHTRVRTTNINENRKAEPMARGRRRIREEKRGRLGLVLDMLYEMILVARVCLCWNDQWRQYDERTTDDITTSTTVTSRTVCPSSFADLRRVPLLSIYRFWVFFFLFFVFFFSCLLIFPSEKNIVRYTTYDDDKRNNSQICLTGMYAKQKRILYYPSLHIHINMFISVSLEDDNDDDDDDEGICSMVYPSLLVLPFPLLFLG